MQPANRVYAQSSRSPKKHFSFLRCLQGIKVWTRRSSNSSPLPGEGDLIMLRLLIFVANPAYREIIWIKNSRVRTHLPSQKMTVEAMQMALKNVWAQRS